MWYAEEYSVCFVKNVSSNSFTFPIFVAFYDAVNNCCISSIGRSTGKKKIEGFGKKLSILVEILTIYLTD
jgi:hypothetical protein